MKELLLEERGVAAISYKDVFLKLEHEIKNIKFDNPITTPIKIYLNESFVKNFDFIEVLKISVIICPIKKYNDLFSTAILNKKAYELLNDKIKEGEIQFVVHTNKDNQTINTTGLLMDLYHDFNHYMELYNILLNTNNKNIYKKYINITKIFFDNNKVITDDVYDKIFKQLFYRLFSKIEMNAVIAGVYGELSELSSKREYFNDDIKKTRAYLFYSLYKYGIDDILNHIDNTNYKMILNLLNKYDIDMFNNLSLNDFKLKIKKSVEIKTKQLLNGISRVSSLYYDIQEELFDNLLINSKPITL